MYSSFVTVGLPTTVRTKNNPPKTSHPFALVVKLSSRHSLKFYDFGHDG